MGERGHEQQTRAEMPQAARPGQRVDPEPGVDHPQAAVQGDGREEGHARPRGTERAGRAAPGRTRAQASSCVPGRSGVEGQAGRPAGGPPGPG